MSSYRFGKHPAKLDYRTLNLKNYFTSRLAPAPPSYNVLGILYDKLGISDPTKLYPMDGNDTLRDCTIAALAHADTTFRGLIGRKEIMPQTAVIKLYMHLTGGVDSGLNELDVLNYWQSNPLVGDKIIAFAKIDPGNHSHICNAIQLFGGVYLGFQVPKNCLQEFSARQPWTPGALTTDGHAVFAVAYDPDQVTVLTWGNTQQGTWAWWDECVDEAYAIIPQEAQNPSFAPGFDLAQLKIDLTAVVQCSVAAAGAAPCSIKLGPSGPFLDARVSRIPRVCPRKSCHPPGNLACPAPWRRARSPARQADFRWHGLGAATQFGNCAFSDRHRRRARSGRRPDVAAVSAGQCNSHSLRFSQISRRASICRTPTGCNLWPGI